jgi:cyclophilin family peptidyl-prolyl cis-trans isomerase
MANPPEMTIDTDAVYRVTIATSRGDIVMDLDARIAPLSVNNFVTLAPDGFYAGLTFHRGEPGFTWGQGRVDGASNAPVTCDG